MDRNKTVENVTEKLLKESPLAIGIFGSSSGGINGDSDIDMYVLGNQRSRTVVRDNGLIFEVYRALPKTLHNCIDNRDIRVIDRMRSSKTVYDPQEIYKFLIERAKRRNLRYEPWVEETIIGSDYDLIERTDASVKKAMKSGEYLSAASSLRYLVDRIVDVGLRRLNIAEHANPRKIPSLVSLLPIQTQKIYEATFKCTNPMEIKALMQNIKDEKNELFPKTE